MLLCWYIALMGNTQVDIQIKKQKSLYLEKKV